MNLFNSGVARLQRHTAMVGLAVAALASAGSAQAGSAVADINKAALNAVRASAAINVCTLATCGVDGEPGWTPFLPTPNFPTYVSGHSSFSGAGSAAISGFFGTDNLNFCVSADALSGVAGQRCYTSLRAAADEAGLSRIFGGIHYEFDNGRALNSGAGIGQFVSANLFQRTAVPEPSSWVMLIAGFGLVGAAMRRRQAAAIAAA